MQSIAKCYGNEIDSAQISQIVLPVQKAIIKNGLQTIKISKARKFGRLTTFAKYMQNGFQ